MAVVIVIVIVNVLVIVIVIVVVVVIVMAVVLLLLLLVERIRVNSTIATTTLQTQIHACTYNVHVAACHVQSDCLACELCPRLRRVKAHSIRQ